MSSFLDNSGDIILDAVLTDVGRRRMANGNFRISKFALGDDEINYGNYDKNHPSGSAYYDLEILQTPVLQAMTAQNAAINYGLLSITNTNLLYMPTMKINQNFKLACLSHNNLYHLAVNSETRNALKVAGALGTDGRKILLANTVSDTQLMYLETGLETTELAANSSNRTTFLVNNDLIDRRVTVEVDNRFISSVFTLDGSESLSAGATSDLVTIPTRMSRAASPTTTTGLLNYSSYGVAGVNNLLFAPTTSVRTEISSITGPRGVLVGLNFGTNLTNGSGTTTPSEFTKFGRTSENLFGTGTNFDYIDTTVRVIGNNSTAIAQIPIRLIRKS